MGARAAAADRSSTDQIRPPDRGDREPRQPVTKIKHWPSHSIKFKRQLSNHGPAARNLQRDRSEAPFSMHRRTLQRILISSALLLT